MTRMPAYVANTPLEQTSSSLEYRPVDPLGRSRFEGFYPVLFASHPYSMSTDAFLFPQFQHGIPNFQTRIVLQGHYERLEFGIVGILTTELNDIQ